MSNPRAKNLPPTNAGARKNPSSTPSPAVKPPNKSISAPSKPAGSSVRPTPRNPPSGTKAPAKAAPAKAAALPKEGNWLNQTVQNTVAGAGGYVGGLINSVGGSVNKVGDGLGNAYVHQSSSLLPSHEKGRYRELRLYPNKIDKAHNSPTNEKK